jgi:UDP-N-acetylmuramate dehydrogenase
VDERCFKTKQPLNELTTLAIGGCARYFLSVKTLDELQEVIYFCEKKGICYVVIGKGSNLVFDDQGYDGLVIRNEISYFSHEAEKFSAGAGYSFALLGVKSARAGWSGLEFASGIPASVGGAVFMNAGANGQEVKDALLSVDVFVPGQGVKNFEKSQLEFSYRSSTFHQEKWTILGAHFVLSPHPDAKKRQLEIINYRTKTQPYGEASAGCIFRNPKGYSAGSLIEKSGLKGMNFGDVAVSDLHANFLVNKGKASFVDFLALVQAVQEKVYQIHGLLLETEIQYISHDASTSCNLLYTREQENP